MRTIKRFEDIQAWQKAREVTRQIYQVTAQGGWGRDFALKEQTRRAAVSIMLNIAEGFARSTDKEFSHFLFQAHGSAAEVQSALYVALDQGYIADAEFKMLYHSVEEISRMLLSFSKYLSVKSGSRQSRVRNQGADSQPRTPDSTREE